jgi:ribonuclease HI
MYVIGCATLGWKRKKNILLWKLFDEVYENAKKLASEINFVHVKGHNGNRYNEMVDKLAVQATQ